MSTELRDSVMEKLPAQTQRQLLDLIMRVVDDNVRLLREELAQVRQTHEGTPQEVHDALTELGATHYNPDQGFRVIGRSVHPRVWLYVRELEREVSDARKALETMRAEIARLEAK